MIKTWELKLISVCGVMTDVVVMWGVILQRVSDVWTVW